MRKRILAVMIGIIMLVSAVAGCTPQPAPAPEPAPVPPAEPITQAPARINGEFSGTAQGFGGEITVTIKVVDDVLTDVTAVGQGETQGIGSTAVDKLPGAILAAKSPEVDGVTGATISSSALIQAARAAFTEAGLLESTSKEAVMKAGTYTGEANGFALCEKLKVNVTVSDSAILDIAVNMEENAETPPLLDCVVKLLVPRMLESQSVRVDSISGATATSSAVKVAVEQCLNDALKAGGSAAAAIEKFYVPTQKGNATEKLSTDILVIGMGGSGTVAAMRAAEGGAQVLAIDKTGRYGGTTGLTSEIMAINPPKIQKEHNNGKNFVDKAAMRKAWLTYTEGDAKEEMVDLMLNRSGEAIDWMVYSHNFEFDYAPKVGFTAADVYPVKYQFIPNTIGANKAFIAKYFDGIYKDFTGAGGKYMLETEGYALIQDANGNVTGAKARNVVDGTEYEISAKAVILATGGFAGNGEMEEKYLSNEYFELKGEWCNYGLNTNDGKMMQAAIDIGAATYNIGMPPMVHNAGTPSFLAGFETVPVPDKMGARTGRPLVWSAGDLPLDMTISKDSMAVDKHGKRFTTETEVAMLNSWIAGPRFYSIWSTTQINAIRDKGFSSTPAGPATIYLGYQGAIPENTPISNAYEVLDAAIAAGIAYKADTIEDLAKQLGIDPATLKNTVDTYNGYCDAGEDKQFQKPAEFLTKIGEGPYYGIVGAPWCYTTCGGLDVNTDFQVLKADGTAIGGLYAIGTDSMGVLFSEKKAYVTFGGAANGWGMTSGYLAGDIVAKAVK